MFSRYGSLAVLLLLVVAAAYAASGFEAGAWYYQKLSRPSWTAPGWLFGAASAVLYVLAALAAWQVWLSGHSARLGALAWWVLLLALNVGWSALFFGMHRIGWAWLLPAAAMAAAVMCIRAFRPLAGQSAYLMVPWLLWVTYLWLLNFVMWSLNGGPLGPLLAA